MRGVTHLLAGLILAAIFVEYIVYERVLLAVVLILLGSVLPDIDERKSLIGRNVPLVGWFVKHRTFFHSILFIVAATILLWFVLEPVYVWSFAGAILLNILLDAMTPAGVQPFWPSKLKIKGFVRVGGLLEQFIFFAAIVLFVYLLLT